MFVFFFDVFGLENEVFIGVLGICEELVEGVVGCVGVVVVVVGGDMVFVFGCVIVFDEVWLMFVVVLIIDMIFCRVLNWGVILL